MSKFSKWLDFNRKHLIPVNRSRGHLLSPFYNFQEEVDNLFQNFYRSLSFTPTEFQDLNISPSIDIVEDENNFKIEVEMPGVDENDIKVSIADNVLNIKAHKKVSRKNEGKNYVMREIGYGSYDRSITLPDNADTDKAESTFKKGMLWVTLPKKSIDKNKVRELEIKKPE